MMLSATFGRFSDRLGPILLGPWVKSMKFGNMELAHSVSESCCMDEKDRAKKNGQLEMHG